MPLIGTAGHVDHGKSSLIQRLTGRDPDRWEEEKRRGLTIDLGFAWTRLPGGAEVSFVDVPGHERYLKNMLAGIEAIDIALFVVAADEGWMPQSEEHLAVLDLLGVDRGLVALTKTDLVDRELLELAAAEVGENLEGTSLELAPVIPVSNTTGEGVAEVLRQLDEFSSQLVPHDVGRPRMWIDRVFSASGAGTVITGTLLDGRLTIDQNVIIYPDGMEARVRGLQSHETSAAALEPGRRVAINLGGVDHSELRRGDMVGLAGQWKPTKRLLARLRTARYVEEFSKKGAFHLHLGSSARRAELTSWDSAHALIQTDQPVVVKAGDAFILRDTGRKLVTAGGVVLDPNPGPAKEAMSLAATIDPLADRDDVAWRLLEIRHMQDAATLDAHTGGGKPVGAPLVGDTYLSQSRLSDLAEAAQNMVENEHERFPLRVGLPLATLAERLGISQQIAEAVVEGLETLRRIGPDIEIVGRVITLAPPQIEAWEHASALLARGLDVPDESALGLDPELIHYLIRTGELVRVGTGIVMLPVQMDELRNVLRGMKGDFTVSEFRDAAGLSRKYAVPILEWADKEGLTVRRGDTRTLR